VSQSSLFGSSAGLETVVFHPGFTSWRQEARRLLRQGRPPHAIWWQPDRSEPRATDGPSLSGEPGKVTVPRAFYAQARLASCHQNEDRWALLYRVLWRLAYGERHLLDLVGDPDVVRLRAFAKSVSRDLHKMKAFVRFRVTADQRYVAWFEPEHHIVEATAGFFQRRFTAMRWSILTPDRCAHWEGAGEVWFSDGASRAAAPDSDVFEEAWRCYYRSIFNPARLKLAAMRAEMPKKYWKNLPEAREIPVLVRQAEARVGTMLAAPRSHSELRCGPRPASPDTLLAREHAVQPEGSLAALRLAALRCRRCPLWEPATQTVFGEGPDDARLMLVGEQPGDQEDLAGRPFVGPAGQMLDRALAEAGIDRSRVYLTNAVKHFRFKPSGKRRLHDRPREGEIDACAPWLDAEIERVQPVLIVCLGATAARARLALRGTLNAHRGRLIERDGRQHLVTVHPSYLLRLPDRDAASAAYQRFVADLRLAARTVAAPSVTTSQPRLGASGSK
jgi:DNA polymerase